MSLNRDVHNLRDNLHDIGNAIENVEKALGEKDDVAKAKGPFETLEREVKELSDKVRHLGEKI